MTSIEDFDIPFSSLETTVISWVAEALELRHGVAGDEGLLKDAPTDTSTEVMALLRRVRTRSDRVDGLLANAISARGRARRAQAEAAFVADNALSQATSNRASRRREFEAGREREADAKLDSFEERRVAHQGARLVDVTQEAYEQINKISWQLNALRSDLRETLHGIQFEASLER